MKPKHTLLKRLIASSVLLCMVVFIPFSGGRSGAQSEDAADTIVRDEVIIEARVGADIGEINRRNRTTTIEQLHGTNFYRLRIPGNKSAKKWRRRLERDPDVLIAALNPLVTTVFGRSVMSFPDRHPDLTNHTEAEFRSQRQVANLLRLDDSHRRSTGEGIVIAVIDTGVDSSHAELAGHMWIDPEADNPTDGRDNDNDGFVDDWRGWDFIDNDNNANDELSDSPDSVAGHGTFIAGLIALMAPDAKIMPIRAFTPAGLSNVFYIAASIHFAVGRGANIINLSCGTTEDSRVLREAIDYAREQGVVVIAAVGNEGTNQKPQYPATFTDQVMGVAAVDQNDRVAYFSNYGASVSVAAPGYELISAYPAGRYAKWSGTSFATPLVAAEAALVLSAEGDSTKTRATIEETALDIDRLNPGYTSMLGKGRIDLLAALQSVLASPVVDLFAAVAMLPREGELTAQGGVHILISDAIHALGIEANGLKVHEAHTLVVDGVQLATRKDELTSDEFGGLQVGFSNFPGDEHPLPDQLVPITGVRHVELRDSQGNVILQSDFGPVTGKAPLGEFAVKEARLSPPGALGRAIGVARVVVDEERAVFGVQADRLVDDSMYEVVADGVSLGSGAALGGFIGLKLTDDGSNGRPLPPTARLAINIKQVEVRDAAGAVVLRGEFTVNGGAIGSAPVITVPTSLTLRKARRLRRAF